MSYSVDECIHNGVYSLKFKVKNNEPNLPTRESTKFIAICAYSVRPTTVGIRMQIVNTATTMANVFANFKATKNLRAKLIRLVDCSVEFSALAIVVSAKIRSRCFRATDKRWKLRKNIKVRGR